MTLILSFSICGLRVELREERGGGWGALEVNGGVRLGGDAGCVCGYRLADRLVDGNGANLFSGLLFGFGAPYDFRRRDEMPGWHRRLRCEQRE